MDSTASAFSACSNIWWNAVSLPGREPRWYFGSPVTGVRNHLRTVLRDKLVIRAISLTDFCWRKCNRRTFPIMAMVITPRPLLKNPAG